MNSYLAILIAALIPMVLGFLWYHPKLFGTAWMNSLGMTEDDVKGGNMPLIFGLSLVAAAFIAWRMNAYSGHTEEGMHQFVHGFYHGAYSAGAVAVAVLISNSLFQRNSLQNILINSLYWLLTLGLMGGFLYTVAPVEAS